VYTPLAKGGWSHRQIALPDNATISLADVDMHSERVFLSVTGFLNPPSLRLADASGGAPVEVKSLPGKFDASKEVVEQFEAVSKD
ncbi:hypothetical protein, partial [Enterococcus faecium]